MAGYRTHDLATDFHSPVAEGWLESLPQDIIDDIVSYLLPDGFKPEEPCDKRKKPSPPLAPLATVSRRLRAAVERLTFKYIEINSETLEDFERIFTAERRPLLKILTFTAILPSYDEAASMRAETPTERAANDESYSRSVQALFRILHSWEVEDPKINDSRMILVINHPESPSDSSWPLKLSQTQYNYETRYFHSYIEFLHLDKLAVLHRVKGLVMVEPGERYGYRNVCPKIPILLASHMPNLESIRVTMDDNEERFPDLRKRNRDEAAQAIRELSLPKLTRAYLTFFHRKYRDETASPPVLHPPGPDPLSSAICQLSLNLVDLEVSGILDISLLQPLQGLNDTSWPSLKYLFIEIQATAPSGAWYFTGRDWTPSSAATQINNFPTSQYTLSTLHEEELNFSREMEYAHLSPYHAFRNRVNEETFVPFIEAYADALFVMPKLRSASLNCELVAEPDGDDDEGFGWFNISFFAPCSSAQKHPPKTTCPKCGRAATRQLITRYLGWVPSEKLAAKLRSIQDTFSKEPMVEKDMDAFMMEHED